MNAQPTLKEYMAEQAGANPLRMEPSEFFAKLKDHFGTIYIRGLFGTDQNGFQWRTNYADGQGLKDEALLKKVLDFEIYDVLFDVPKERTQTWEDITEDERTGVQNLGGLILKFKGSDVHLIPTDGYIGEDPTGKKKFRIYKSWVEELTSFNTQ